MPLMITGTSAPAGNDDLRLALRQSRRSHHSKAQCRLDKTHEQPAIGAKLSRIVGNPVGEFV